MGKTNTNPVLTELEQMKAQIAKLQAENEAMKNAKSANRKLSCKVSPKGALSVYGMGRFPVTLYVEQWEFLLSNQKVVVDFIEAHRSELTTKQ